jgi:hypothetical protein
VNCTRQKGIALFSCRYKNGLKFNTSKITKGNDMSLKIDTTVPPQTATPQPIHPAAHSDAHKAEDLYERMKHGFLNNTNESPDQSKSLTPERVQGFKGYSDENAIDVPGPHTTEYTASVVKGGAHTLAANKVSGTSKL